MKQAEEKSIKSWKLSDEFWEKVKDKIPTHQRDPNKTYKRKSGGGRKPIEPRRVLEGIFYVLRTGIQWKALPKEYGAASSVHKYFLEWTEAGFFEEIWKMGLAEYDELEGIGWEWQSADGSMLKAPLAIEAVGKNPTDRGKKGKQKKHSGG